MAQEPPTSITLDNATHREVKIHLDDKKLMATTVAIKPANYQVSEKMAEEEDNEDAEVMSLYNVLPKSFI